MCIHVMYVPSVNALFNAFATESVATAGDAGLLDARHANGALKVLVEYSNLHDITAREPAAKVVRFNWKIDTL